MMRLLRSIDNLLNDLPSYLIPFHLHSPQRLPSAPFKGILKAHTIYCIIQRKKWPRVPLKKFSSCRFAYRPLRQVLLRQVQLLIRMLLSPVEAPSVDAHCSVIESDGHRNERGMEWWQTNLRWRATVATVTQRYTREGGKGGGGGGRWWVRCHCILPGNSSGKKKGW